MFNLTCHKKTSSLQSRFACLFLIGLIATLSGCGSGSDAVTITITPDGNNMTYATTTFEVSAGQQVTLIMDNTATIPVMKHNVVILKDKNAIQAVGQAAITVATYIPDHPAIIAATPIADPGQQTQTTFTAPSEPGEYVYICTFPGHYITMQGVMVVR